MAIDDGDTSTPGTGPREESTDERDPFEVLDEDGELKMHHRGPREGRWPANDYY